MTRLVSWLPTAAKTAALIGCVVQLANAQGVSPLVVRVHVVGPQEVAVTGAELTVVHSLARVVGRTTTDSTGRATLVIARDSAHSTDFNVIVRKIGFERADRFVAASAANASFEIKLTAIVQTLPATTVTAREDVVRRNYYIGADDIASSDRPLVSGTDVIEKLRPQMIWGLAGPPTAHGGPVCEKLSAVFVNGQLIRSAPADAAQRVADRTPNPQAANYAIPASGRISPKAAEINKWVAAGIARQSTYKVTGLPGAILESIKPEHIAEIRHNDCFEKQIKINRGANAVFVILKPGIGYSQEYGSYVLEGGEPLPPYRLRLMGLYDAASGAPIVGAEVLDVRSGTRGSTSTTGTIALAFLAEGSSQVRLSAPGYEPMTVAVTISPADTVPITLSLPRKSVPLAVSAARLRSDRLRYRGSTRTWRWPR